MYGFGSTSGQVRFSSPHDRDETRPKRTARNSSGTGRAPAAGRYRRVGATELPLGCRVPVCVRHGQGCVRSAARLEEDGREEEGGLVLKPARGLRGGLGATRERFTCRGGYSVRLSKDTDFPCFREYLRTKRSLGAKRRGFLLPGAPKFSQASRRWAWGSIGTSTGPRGRVLDLRFDAADRMPVAIFARPLFLMRINFGARFDLANFEPAPCPRFV